MMTEQLNGTPIKIVINEQTLHNSIILPPFGLNFGLDGLGERIIGREVDCGFWYMPLGSLGRLSWPNYGPLVNVSDQYGYLHTPLDRGVNQYLKMYGVHTVADLLTLPRSTKYRFREGSWGKIIDTLRHLAWFIETGSDGLAISAIYHWDNCSPISPWAEPYRHQALVDSIGNNLFFRVEINKQRWQYYIKLYFGIDSIDPATFLNHVNAYRTATRLLGLPENKTKLSVTNEEAIFGNLAKTDSEQSLYPLWYFMGFPKESLALLAFPSCRCIWEVLHQPNCHYPTNEIGSLRDIAVFENMTRSLSQFRFKQLEPLLRGINQQFGV